VELIIIGGGIIGRSASWHLQQRGHQVTLIDPDLHLETPANPLNGSRAALGLLMAQVFHRASGRAWRLRQRSLELWGPWVEQLRAQGHPLELRRGLLLLASDPIELERQQALVQQRQALGLPLEWWDAARIKALQPELPPALGGLWSAADGQIDPLPLLQALGSDARRLGARLCAQAVINLQRNADGSWRVELANGEGLTTGTVVICAGASTAPLLHTLGLTLPLAAVLGQAVELQPASATPAWSGGPQRPAAVVWQGINLVPRPDGRLWLGATCEPGSTADPQALEALASLNGQAPAWLRQAQRLRQWQGVRLQPQGRAAPWLERLAPGLLLASGHYRNGLLLAPATAEWIAAQVEQPQSAP